MVSSARARLGGVLHGRSWLAILCISVAFAAVAMLMLVWRAPSSSAGSAGDSVVRSIALAGSVPSTSNVDGQVSLGEFARNALESIQRGTTTLKPPSARTQDAPRAGVGGATAPTEPATPRPTADPARPSSPIAAPPAPTTPVADPVTVVPGKPATPPAVGATVSLAPAGLGATASVGGVGVSATAVSAQSATTSSPVVIDQAANGGVNASVHVGTVSVDVTLPPLGGLLGGGR